MARLKLSKAKTYLAYAERKRDEATDPERREFWTAKADFYRRALAGRCQRCGRELQDPSALLGPECQRVVNDKARAS